MAAGEHTVGQWHVVCQGWKWTATELHLPKRGQMRVQVGPPGPGARMRSEDLVPLDTSDVAVSFDQRAQLLLWPHDVVRTVEGLQSQRVYSVVSIFGQVKP